jgi:hypothetical protein
MAGDEAREAQQAESGEPLRDASIERPRYAKVAQQDGKATHLFMIVVDEGWRESVMCVDMFGWAADWLVNDVLANRPPYAPRTRPGSKKGAA